MNRLLATTLALAAGAAGAAVLASIGLTSLAMAAYNLRRNEIGPGGEPVRDPAMFGLLLIAALLVLMLLFALARTPRPVRAAITTLGLTSIAAAVILPIGFLVMMFAGSASSSVLIVIIVAVVAACAAFIATRVQRAHLRRQRSAQMEQSEA